MPNGIQERVAVSPTAPGAQRESQDWESATGPHDSGVQSRAQQPVFRYVGLGDEHLRGQTCHVLEGRQPARPHERVVIMACGCQASVPWWTLESSALPESVDQRTHGDVR
jgi:hypothetical protein